ncbi:MAG: hypothetical protein U0401_24005 [Anaerolineae bacterium]
MRRALWHESVDRLPTQINYTNEMGQLLCDYFKVSPAELPDRCQFFDELLILRPAFGHSVHLRYNHF